MQAAQTGRRTMQAAHVGMQFTFQSSSENDGAPGYRERSGQTVSVVRELGEEEIDRGEVGRMYLVRFSDGLEIDAFADELE